MNWKDVLKAHCSGEKSGCAGCPSCEKQNFEKNSLVIKKGLMRITTKKLQEKSLKSLNDPEKNKAVKSDSQIEKEIIAMFKKEGGALGMKNLKPIAPPKELNRILAAMMRRKVIYKHKHGDLIMR